MYMNDHATVGGTGISCSWRATDLLAMDTTGAEQVTMNFKDHVGDDDAPDKVVITCVAGASDTIDYNRRKAVMSTMAKLANSVNKQGHVVAFDTLNSINPNSADISSIAITLNS